MTGFRVIDKAGRRLFEGLEKDAREFITKNFPRVHVQPGNESVEDAVPDVTLVAPDKSEDTYHGPDAGWKSEQEAPASQETEDNGHGDA